LHGNVAIADRMKILGIVMLREIGRDDARVRVLRKGKWRRLRLCDGDIDERGAIGCKRPDRPLVRT